jgi:hypothetical protein
VPGVQGRDDLHRVGWDRQLQVVGLGHQGVEEPDQSAEVFSQLLLSAHSLVNSKSFLKVVSTIETMSTKPTTQTTPADLFLSWR